MLGKPLYQEGDIVRFNTNNKSLIGTIYVVDKWGTWEDASDVSYDIFIAKENMLYKHIPECLITSKVADERYYGN